MYVLNPDIFIKDNLTYYDCLNCSTGERYKIGKNEYAFLMAYSQKEEHLICEWDDKKKQEAEIFFFEHNFLIVKDNFERKSKKNSSIIKIYLFDINLEKLFSIKWFNRIIEQVIVSFKKILICVLVLDCLLSLLLLKGLIEHSVEMSKFINVRWFSVYLFELILLLLHECGHACLCKYYSGRVRKAGLMLFFLQPVMYVDVTETYLLSQKERNHVLLGGIYSQILVALLTIQILEVLYVKSGILSSTLLMMLISNISTIILNIFPFIKLDGYWILANYVRIDNLMEKSLKYLLGILKKQNYENEFTNREKKVLLFFGIGAGVTIILIWTILIVSLFIILSKYNFYAAVIICSIIGFEVLREGVVWWKK